MSGSGCLSLALRFGMALALGLALPGAGLAQTGREPDTFRLGGIGGDAYLQRQIRALDADQRGGSLSPGQIGQTQRDLITRSRGVNLTPEQSRLQGDLDRLQQERSWQATTGERPPIPTRPAAGDRLPGTIDDEGGLPSFSGTATAGLLLGRAQDAIAAGRTGQARSDLATARALVDGFGGDDAAERATIADLQARMADLSRRLGDS